MKVKIPGKIIFLDGRYIEADDALFEALSPGVVKGKGVFETMRVYEGRIFALEDHWIRLKMGAQLLKMTLTYTPKEIEKRLYRIVELNRLTEAGIRLVVWQESQRRTRVSVVGRPLPPRKQQGPQGYRAVISEIRHKKTKYSHLKTIDYALLREAFLKAKRRGYDEAILLNHRDELVEGSRTNIFFIKNDVLYTSPVKSGCLNGVTRRYVIRCAHQLGIPCKMKTAPLEALLTADEAFLTNSIIEVMPLIVAGGQKIGGGKAGRVTGRLLAAYRELVRKSFAVSVCSVKGESV